MSDKKLFMFVDDSRVSRMKIKQITGQKRPDLEMIEMSSAEEAVTKTETCCPDLISLDINMPGMNGLDAVALLRKNCPTAKIVLLSGNIQDDMKQQAQQLGVGFVEKPITEDCIAQVLAFLP